MSAMKCLAFSKISERVRPFMAVIANDAWIIGHLDLIRAKRSVISKKGKLVPLSSENQEIQLLHMSAILWSKMVANDVSILVNI